MSAQLDLLPERVRRRIGVVDDCWRWIGWIDRQGYGRLRDDGQTRMAHRVVYRLLVGPIPDGMDIGHLCHDRAAHAGECAGGLGCIHRMCVNPSHLAPQTTRENLFASPTSASSRWAARTHCLHGHEYTPENTHLGADGRGCRACDRLYQRRARIARLGPQRLDCPECDDQFATLRGLGVHRFRVHGVPGEHK